MTMHEKLLIDTWILFVVWCLRVVLFPRLPTSDLRLLTSDLRLPKKLHPDPGVHRGDTVFEGQYRIQVQLADLRKIAYEL